MDPGSNGRVQSGFTAWFQEFPRTAVPRNCPASSPAMSPSTLRLLTVLLLASAAGVATADPRDEERDDRRNEARERATQAHQARAERHSLAESVRRVERQTGGQILSAERVPFDGRDMNRIKVVDSTGRVRVITEDPQGRPPRGD